MRDCNGSFCCIFQYHRGLSSGANIHDAGTTHIQRGCKCAGSVSDAKVGVADAVHNCGISVNSQGAGGKVVGYILGGTIDVETSTISRSNIIGAAGLIEARGANATDVGAISPRYHVDSSHTGESKLWIIRRSGATTEIESAT